MKYQHNLASRIVFSATGIVQAILTLKSRMAADYTLLRRPALPQTYSWQVAL